MPRQPVILAVLVLIAGTCWAWLGGPPFHHGVNEVCAGFANAEEGTSAGTSLSWWPPGAIDCVITTPDGSRRESTFLPWRDYLSVALFAAAVAAASMGLTRRQRRRARWIGLGGLLTVASLVALFG